MHDALPTELRNDKDGSALVLIPAGAFLMGSEEGFPVERPVHRVFLDAFYLGKYPVTNAQYERESPAQNPQGPEKGAVRGLRGGAWLLFAQFCRVAYRFRNSPDFRFNLIGFRLALSPPEPPPGTTAPRLA